MKKRLLLLSLLLSVWAGMRAQLPSATLGTNSLPVTIVPEAEPGTPYVRSLNGTWRFDLLTSIDAPAPAGWTEDTFDDRDWADIQVPGCWETQGFKAPAYGRDLEAMGGLYRTHFTLPAHWAGRHIVLRTEGVHMSYECWLNGHYVGCYGSACHAHNLDVTPFVREGSNTLCFKVTTRSRAWRFETVDNWTYTGINRDVTLFALPDEYIEDITFVSENCTGDQADIRVSMSTQSHKGQPRLLRVALVDEQGHHIADIKQQPDAAGKAVAKAHLKGVALWTAETPRLYTLRVSLCDSQGRELHRATRRVGLREVKREGREILVNGTPVKLHGVCVSEVHPYLGNAYTPTEWHKQLALMQRAHINFVRTAHYPLHPAFYDLCDEMGFYVCCEVPLASRGGEYLKDSTYNDEVEARAIATVARDKNHPCVILWSMGNENSNPTGLLATLMKALDPTRLRGFPQTMGVASRMMRNPHPDVDVIMGHYMRENMLDDMAARAKLPFLQTEYAHSLGLGSGEMEQKWERILRTPGFAGGSVWCWMDGAAVTRGPQDDLMQGVMTDSLHYLDSYGYKKVTGEEVAKEANDGIVYADGTPSEDYYVVRKVYCPVQVKEEAVAFPLRLTVLNRYDFRSLTGYTLRWQLLNLHTEVAGGSLALSAAAHSEEQLQLPAARPATAVHNDLTLRLTIEDAAGQSIHERVLPVAFGEKDYAECLATAPRDEAVNVHVTRQGHLVVRTRDGHTLVDSPLYLRVGRQPSQILKLRVGKDNWNPYLLEPTVRSCRTRRTGEGTVTRIACRWYRKPGSREYIDGEVTVKVQSNGATVIDYTLEPSAKAGGKLTECGLTLRADSMFDTFRWLGKGIFSSVPGKSRHNERGCWSLHRDDHRFTGNRAAVDLALLTAPDDTGLLLHSAGGNLAVENIGGHICVTQSVHVAGYGSKFSVPSEIISPQELKGLYGQLILLPRTAPTLHRSVATLFATDGVLPRTVPDRPFHREYGW